MLIVEKRTAKRTRLRFKTCPICNIEFGAYRERKVCSKICSNKLNGLNKKRGLFKTCPICKQQWWCRNSWEKIGRKFCSAKCQNHNKKLGLPVGQYFSYDGYIVVGKTPDGRKQIKLHRLIMEEFLNRRLSIKEIVHHKNGNKIDNRLENLEIMSRSEHNISHGFLKRKR